MKLMRMMCPQCGATMDFNEDHTKAICSYCGCEMYVEEECSSEEAYEIRRQNRINQQIEELEHIAKCIPKEQKARAQVNEAERKRKAAKESVENLMKQHKGMPFGVVIAALLSIWIGAYIDIGILSKVLWVFLTIGGAAAVFYLMKFRYERELPQLEAAALDAEENLKRKRQSLQDIRDQYDISVLPKNLQDLKAIQYVIKMLRSGRAQNISAAEILYEEYLERENLHSQLELQRQQMKELQKSVQNGKKGLSVSGNSEADSSVDGADVLGTAAAVGGAFIVGAKVMKEIGKHL